MKKFVLMVSMLVMLFAFGITANAEVSPSGKPQASQSTTTTEESTAPATNVSPKTGDSYTLLYGLGIATVVLVAGTSVVGKKAKEA